MSYKDILNTLREIYSITENDELRSRDQISAIQFEITALFERLGEAI